MRDEHTHCPCNGVLLCNSCHGWAHAHPLEARGQGFIISRHTANPGGVVIRSYFGLLTLDCEGGYSYARTGLV